MKFHHPLCPECGSPADAILEHVPVWADIIPMNGDAHISDSEEDDKKVDRYEYGDESRVCWDSQQVLVEGNPQHARVTLRCERCEHEWATAMIRDPAEKSDTMSVYAVKDVEVILQTPAPKSLFSRRIR